MKWKLALRIANSPSDRWPKKAADWNPELSTSYRTNRAIGRPIKRWEDDINEFLKQEFEVTRDPIEKHMVHNNKYIPIIGGDFNADLGPGKRTERKSVGRYTLNESNKRGDWLKSWLMLNDYSALNTMCRKTPQKQTSFVSPKGKEKQIDYILTKRRYVRNVKAEANDMIHMGSDNSVSWLLS